MPALIRFTDKGLYCPKAEVYIDPWRPVDKALITHGHSDHSRKGHKSYLCHHHSVEIIKHRLGKIAVQGIGYNENLKINDVTISFHPAGHVLGSAQIKLQDKNESWVVTGDYKLQDDGVAAPYEPVMCDHFITESTFGLPVFRWEDQHQVYADISKWWSQNAAQGITSMVCAYSLGKAQRVLHNIDASIGPIITHPAVEHINVITRAHGISLPPTCSIDEVSAEDKKTALLICPPAAQNSKWVKGIKHISVAMASGWMALRGTRRRRNFDKGFILSDHVDWPDLNTAVKNSGAEHIYVTHGYTDIYTRYLNETGYTARVVETEYEGEGLGPELKNAD